MTKPDQDTVTPTSIIPPRKPRGFAAISPERVREIASKGGKAAHAVGTAHKFTTEEAKAAGRKGGNAPHRRRGKAPKVVVPSTPTPDGDSVQ